MLHWITAALPPWAERLIAWMWQPAVRVSVVIASVLMFVGSVIAVPWLIVRVPADYFTRAHDDDESPLASKLLRNAAGSILLLLGVAMLVLPGQGILAIVAALLIMDFPGKRRLERRIIAVPRVFRAVNALRRRAGRAPFEWDPDAG